MIFATVTEGYFKDRNVAVLSEENDVCNCELSGSGEDVLIPKSQLSFWKSVQSVKISEATLDCLRIGLTELD